MTINGSFKYLNSTHVCICTKSKKKNLDLYNKTDIIYIIYVNIDYYLLFRAQREIKAVYKWD